MSNLKKGRKVRLVSTGELGIIKDIERVKRSDGIRVDVTYMVKMLDRPGWVTCGRKALQLIPNPPKETEHRYIIKKTVRNRVITVVGAVIVIKDTPLYEFDGDRYTGYRLHGQAKRLCIGWSICHPDDKDTDYGTKLARRRCEERPLADYYTPFMGEFREEMVMAVLETKLNYIAENIEKFTNSQR